MGVVCRFVTHRLWVRLGTTVWRVHGANSFSSSDDNGAGTDPIMGDRISKGTAQPSG